MEVLLVIDSVTNNVLRPNGGAYVEELEEARAAIAELIEADKEYDEAYAAAVANPAKEAWLADAEERRASALARVGGA